jgi:hypothetical protein
MEKKSTKYVEEKNINFLLFIIFVSSCLIISLFFKKHSYFYCRHAVSHIHAIVGKCHNKNASLFKFIKFEWLRGLSFRFRFNGFFKVCITSLIAIEHLSAELWGTHKRQIFLTHK